MRNVSYYQDFHHSNIFVKKAKLSSLLSEINYEIVHFDYQKPFLIDLKTLKSLRATLHREFAKVVKLINHVEQGSFPFGL